VFADRGGAGQAEAGGLAARLRAGRRRVDLSYGERGPVKGAMRAADRSGATIEWCRVTVTFEAGRIG